MSRAIGGHIPRGDRQYRETLARRARPDVVVTVVFDGSQFARAFERLGEGIAAADSAMRDLAVHAGESPATLTAAPYEYRQPVHHDPHQCPDCGMCLCACEDCHTRLAQHCICADCPCGLGETGSGAEVAAFEATHWKHAEETT